MKVVKKQLDIEAIEFTGDNFDEIKSLVPHLEKYTFREGYEYTIGWGTKVVDPDGIQTDSFTEALPGFFIIKEFNEDGPEDDNYFILEPEEFKKLYK